MKITSIWDSFLMLKIFVLRLFKMATDHTEYSRFGMWSVIKFLVSDKHNLLNSVYRE